MPELWRWHRERGQGTREMRRVLGEAGVQATPRMAQIHFGSHRQAQPAPLGVTSRKRAHGNVRRIEPRMRAILDLVWRMRSVSTELVSSLYYEAEGVDAEVARQCAVGDLHDLARANMLHRFHPPKQLEDHRRKEILWFLGREAIPWLEERYGVSIDTKHYVTSEKQIGTLMLNHDMTINRLLDQMRVRGREHGIVMPDGLHVQLDMPPANWYGARHLGLGYVDRSTSVRRTLISDGFAAVSGRAFEPREGFPSAWLCPFFFEFDRGGRETREVVEQLMSYHWLGLDNAAGKRFPELDVSGYVTPIVMVFRSERRVGIIAKKVRARAAEHGITRGAPIMLMSQEDLERGGWHEPTVTFMWDPEPERRWPLYRLLEQMSLPLIRSGRVGPKVPLTLDSRGAPRVPTAPSEESRRRARLAKKQAALNSAASVDQPALNPAPITGATSLGVLTPSAPGGQPAARLP